MKITSKLLSIPPHLSTAWKNIETLHAEPQGDSHFSLIVLLRNRVQIKVPGLTKEEIDAIFEAHAKYAEKEGKGEPGGLSFGFPLKLDSSLEGFGSAMQHNPEQSDFPPLPPEILNKIGSIAQALGVEDLSLLSKPESNCHCPYCQIAHALQSKEEKKEGEEEVSEADLTFRNWDIAQTGEKLYLVTNPLDKNEHYNVFLGQPLGCTCGAKNCEHLQAVLKT